MLDRVRLRRRRRRVDSEDRERERPRRHEAKEQTPPGVRCLAVPNPLPELLRTAIRLLLYAFVVCLVHEIAHAVVATLAGGEVSGMYVTPWFGFVKLTREPASLLGNCLTDLAGLFINLVMGGFALHFARREATAFPLRKQLSLFAAVSILGTLIYFVSSLVTNFGDAFSFVDRLGVHRTLRLTLIAGALASFPFVTYLVARPFGLALKAEFPESSYIRRARHALSTVGLAVVAIYASALAWESYSDVAISVVRPVRSRISINDGGPSLHHRAIEQKRQHPDLSEEDAFHAVLEAKRAEIPDKRILLLLPILLGVGSLLALRTSRPTRRLQA